MRSRLYRRKQKIKFRRKAQRILQSWGLDSGKDEYKRIVYRIEQNRAKCSCSMCSYPKYDTRRVITSDEDMYSNYKMNRFRRIRIKYGQ